MLNLKRKIDDNDLDIIPQIVHDYRKKFCVDLSNVPLCWKDNYLFDKRNRQARYVIRKDANYLICDKRVKKHSFEWIPNSLPKLPNDVIKSILKFIPSWELLHLRFVSKQWNNVIVNTFAFWNLKSIPHARNTMRDYIHYMFLNVKSDEQIVEYLFRYPDFFFFICELVFEQNWYRGKPTKYTLRFGNYVLHRRAGELTSGLTKIKIQNFMEVYRQKICMQLPASFRIRD